MGKPTKTQTIESVGVDSILSMIRGGKAQTEIAAELGVGTSTLNEWLHGDPERSARTREAMAVSAETWLDRGLVALQDAPPEAAEIARARAIEQHCARRAAIRDPARYGDRTTLAGDPEAPLLGSDEQLIARAAAILASAKGEGSAG